MQTIQEKAVIVDTWSKSKYFPQNLLETEHNFRVLAREVETIPNLTITDIVNIVNRLGDIANGGKLQYAPKPPEKVIEYRVPEKTDKEKAKEIRQAKIEAGVVFNRTELDRKIEKPQPTAEQVTNARYQRILDHPVTREAATIIGRYIGKSHARTSNVRNVLKAELHRLAMQGVEPAQIKATINQKLSELDSSVNTSIR
jgi:hypothetical protein